MRPYGRSASGKEDYGRAYSHLSLINEINLALNTTVDTRISLGEAVSLLADYVGGASAVLLAMREGAELLEPVLSVGPCEVREEGLERATAFFLEAASVIDLLPDGLVRALGYGEDLAACGLAAPADPHYVTVTLKSRRRPIGLLHVNLPNERVLHDDEALLLSALGSQLGAALENAWLFEEVNRGRREWQDTFDSIDDVIILTDGEGRLKQANEAFRRYVDAARPDGDLIGGKASFFREVLSRTSLYPPSRAAGSGWEEVEEAGSRRVWRVFSFKADDDGGAYVARDVTVDRRMEEVQEMNRQLVELNRMRSDFMARVSHDLRTPLNAILGFSEVLLQEDCGPLNEKQRKYLGNIYSSGRHLLDLINDVLDLSRLEAGRLELDLGEVDLGRVIRACLAIFEEEARRRGIALHLDGDPLPSAVRADERRVRQVLFNLLSNAVKFVSDGGSVGVRVSCENGSARVEVWDDGAGIPPEKQGLIFEEYAHLPGGKGEGIGLGLAITKQLVEMHGGRVWVESSVGRGSSFLFTLPLASGPRESVSLKEGGDDG